MGLTGLCCVGSIGATVMRESASDELKRLEQLAEVDEYKSLDSCLRVMDQANEDSRYNFPLLGSINRKDALLQDPEVQEYLSSQTQKDYGQKLGVSSFAGVMLMAGLRAYYSRKEWQSSSSELKQV